MYDQLQQVINEFLLDCEARGHSRATLVTYRNALRFFATWATGQDVEKLKELTPTHLREYGIYCVGRLSPGGAHARLRPVKTLLKWAFQEEFIDHDVTRRMRLPKLERKEMPAVRQEDFKKLMAVAHTKSRFPLRDAALLTVLYDTGLRASEMLNLELSDIKSEGFLLVRKGKGGKSRSVPVERTTVRTIRSYIQYERHDDPGTQLLFLVDDHPMSRGALDKLLDRFCEFAGINRLSAHAFRRGFAVQYLRNQGDVFTLQRILGHTSLEMSNRYAMLVTDDLKVVHRRASPLRAGPLTALE